ncbi:hydroxyacid dehydrogenase [Streptomyces oceani]|uniref:Hydroxyacid dehydrogenase n=1 Tax=Streptomyces oceani TaxID=1075402 RepID=A0A1E7KF44_9ACTN|nr:hydroxyacid dehydrogenase [Streptomyces oceani]OEV02526.1 hydroxyacid dehydrogenase [Streptomyces oceani]
MPTESAARFRPRAALAMSSEAARSVLTPTARAALAEHCALTEPPVLDEFGSERARAALVEAELLVTGWGCPPITAEVLATAPRLRALVHTAGSVRGHVTEACWERGIQVSSAARANALPVAEYTVAMILLSGKHVLERARRLRTERVPASPFDVPDSVGNYQRTIGILSASLIGRRVIELLRPYDLRLLLHDPYVSAAEASELGARAVSSRELFAQSDTVSVHTPLLPETRGLVDRELLDAMPRGATLINTARGAVVDQDALTDAVRQRRIRAVLDVTDPDPLPTDHPLWDCEDALITPHLAGSQGNEWQRLAESAVAEVGRWVAGESFAHPVRRDQLAAQA